MHSTQSDADLIYQLNKQNLAAYEAVYKQYWVLLYQHARRVLGEDLLAEDIVQDIFVRLYQKMGDIPSNLNIRKWLYSCVRNRAIDEIRKGQVRKQYIQHLDNNLNLPQSMADHRLLEQDLNAQIDAEIAKLPPKTKQVFELSWRNHLSHREIAQNTSVSLGTIRKQFQNAVKVLRENLHRLPILL
jgi:RNA polymerase sigma-70 factor, ECF subfamily